MAIEAIYFLLAPLYGLYRDRMSDISRRLATYQSIIESYMEVGKKREEEKNNA